MIPVAMGIGILVPITVVASVVDALPAGAATITAPGSGWTLSTHASLPSTGVLQLTPNALNEAGLGVYDTALTLNTANPITVSFELYMYGGTTTDGGDNADGITADLFTSKPSSPGIDGGGMGIGGLPVAMGVSFDTFNDHCGDAGDNFVAFTDGSTGCGGATLQYTLHQKELKQSLRLVKRHVTITFRSTSAAVSIDNDQQITETYSALPSTVYFGFTGSTGSADDIHQISQFTSGPVLTATAKQTLALGALGPKGPTTCTNGKNPVNCASGDFWHSFTDASVAGYGPHLDLIRTYNSANADIEGIFGYGWSSSYDSNLVVNDDGSVTITGYDGSQVTAESDGSGGFVMPSDVDSTLTVSGSNYVYNWRNQQIFTYNSSGQLLSIADNDGATTNLAYTSGKLVTVTDPSSRTLTFAYGTNGLVSSVTDPMSRETQYFYNASDELTSVEDPLGRVTSFTYDTGGAHLMLTMTMPNGQSGGPDAGASVTNTYDSDQRIVTQTDQNGQETTYAYTGDNFSEAGGSTTVTDPDGNVTVQNYVSGELQTDVKGSSTWTYAYDPTTLGLISEQDPNSNTTSATYDADGDRITSTNQLGNTTTYSYNAFDEQTCMAQPLAANPCSSLTPPSAITAGTATITPPSSAPPKYVTYTEYDTDGNKIYTTTGDYNPGSGTASQSRTTYDLYNGQSVTLSGTTDSCTTSAPSSGLPCATIDANKVVTQLAYDSYGDLTASSTPDGNAGGEVSKTTSSYDTDGEMTSTVAPNGNLSGANAANYTTSDTYNVDGEVTAQTVAGASGSTIIPRKTSYGYDGDGNVTSTTKSVSIQNIGSTSGTSSSGSLSLSLPAGTRSGDTAILSTTTSPVTSLRQLTANDIYTIVGDATVGLSGDQGQATDPQLDNPEGVTTDAAGNIYVADSLHNEVLEIPATTHTQFGIAMTAGDIYRLIGSATGSSGTSGDGGAGTSALLKNPVSVAVDKQGDLYVVDQNNNRIQELAATTHGQFGQSMTANDVYTILGSTSGSHGTSGDGGVGTSARLYLPSDVKVNANGDVYVADTNNNRIQELAATEEKQWGQAMSADDVYTIVGSSSGSSGTSGDGGIGTSARLNQPSGIGFDPNGDLLIGDSGNNRLQELSALTRTEWSQSMTAGDIYTIAGSSSGSSGYSGDGGAASSALLNQPGGVTVDASGNIYFSDSNNGRIQEIAAVSGTQWGQSMTAQDIYTVAGCSTGTTGYAGDGANATTSGLLKYPTFLSLDPAGNLIIADPENEVIREVVANSASQVPQTNNDVYTVAGNRGSVSASDGVQATNVGLGSAKGTVVDTSGDVYIAENGANRVQEQAGTTHTQWGISMVAGDLYTILGSASGTAGSTGNGGAGTSAELSAPGGLALDAAGDLYVADSGNDRIQELAASSGTQWGQSMTTDDVYTVAGVAGMASGSGDGGAATSANLDAPLGVAFDAAGDLYIADTSNSRIQEVAASSGTQWGQSMTANDIYTVAGSAIPSSGHSGDGGLATSAKLDGPIGVTLDASGNLYVADTVNNRIQEVAASSGTQWGQSMTANDIYTVAGSASGSSGHSGNGGAATSALLSGPTNVAIDNAGNIDIADASNNRLQFVAATSGTQWGQSVTAHDIYTFAGSASGSSGYSGDGGVGTSALFTLPVAFSIDSAGDVYVTDTNNGAERELVKSNVGSSQSTSTPSGYTSITSSTVGATTTSVFRHTISSGDTGVTVSFSSDAPTVATLTVYRGLSSTTPIDTSSTGSTSSGTSVSTSALTTTDPGDELVFIGGAGQLGSFVTWTSPSGFASQVANSANAPLSDFTADTVGPAPDGSTGSATATTSGTAQLTGVFLALSPGTFTSTDTYDADDQLTVATDADGQSTLTCYDGDGNVAETVPPIGVAANSLTAASCPTSYPTNYGDRLASDATTTAYNTLNEKTTVTAPAPAGLSGYETTSYAYDPAGRLTSVTAPPTSNTGGAADNVTAYTYDAAGEMLTTTTGSGTGVASVTSDCYDPDGDKTATVAPDGNTSGVATCGSSSPWDTSSSYQTTYSYDSLGEVVTTTRPATTAAPSGQVTTVTYDPDGNVLTSVSPDGVTTTNTYTPLDQVATISYSGDSADDVTDTYNANGDRTQMTDASGTSTYTYDVFDEMTESEQGCGTITRYGYDSLGDQTSITYDSYVLTLAPSDVIKYAYDAADEMTGITDFNGVTNAVTNNADGLATSLALGLTGDTIDSTFDATDAPSEIALDNGGASPQSFSYSDVPSTQIASETDAPTSTLSPADYVYDAQGRVTKDTPGSTSALNYTEDASGNLTTLPTGASTTYDDASELTASTLSGTTTDYGYDADGSRTSESVSGTGTMSATYSAPNYLTSYDNASADMTSSIYDGDGLLVQESETFTDHTSATVQFQYDQSTSTPLLLADNNHNYIYGPDGEPFEEQNSDGSMNYMTTDAIDSVRGVTNAAGSLIASTSYDAWGNPETPDGVRVWTFLGYASGWADATGLDYFINRYYDPSTGQFISVDRMVDETGQPYAYTGDDPVNGIDPLGLISGCGPIPGCGVITDVQNGVANVSRSVNSYIAEHGGTLADIGAGLVCVLGGPESFGSACLPITALVGSAETYETVSQDIASGDSANKVVQDALLQIATTGANLTPAAVESIAEKEIEEEGVTASEKLLEKRDLAGGVDKILTAKGFYDDLQKLVSICKEEQFISSIND